ncbi:hypothetical protein [Niveispirillum fermenti]|uniref:hypothetical protein n=1 Tax=Niveispirillum fermenti TaxID=1233113 RepID=UPI003A88A834
MSIGKILRALLSVSLKKGVDGPDERGRRHTMGRFSPPHSGKVGKTTGSSSELGPTLRRIFKNNDPTQAGSIHLVGLESLREKLGNRWGAVADRVHQLTERLLRQQLKPADAWFRYNNESYVVVFASLGPSESRLICAKILEELQRMLLGEADAQSIVVHTAVYEMNSDVMFEPARLCDMLDNFATQAREDVAADQSSTKPWNGYRYNSQENWGPLEIKYAPFWDTRTGTVSVFMARPMRSRPERSPVWGYDCLENPEDPAPILEMDIQVMRSAVVSALELHDQRVRFFLSLPVHFESLAVIGRRREFQAALLEIPGHMRPFLTYHIVGAPSGVPVGRLAEMVSLLRPFGRMTMVMLEAGSGDLPAVAAAGAKVACTALPPGTAGDRLRQDMLRFATTAAKLRLRTSVEGVMDSAMGEFCEAAGVSFIGGPLISNWLDRPRQAMRRTREEVLNLRVYESGSHPQDVE